MGGAAVLLAALALLSLALGSVSLPLGAVLEGLFGAPTPAGLIVREIRLPRTLTAILAGAALASSGLQMQTLFRNPLAGPFVLGITGGASLGVALVMLASAAGLGWLATSSWSVAVAAAGGAALVLGLIAAVAARVQDGATLLIVGLMFGTFAGAIVQVLQFYSAAEAVKRFLLWTFADFGAVTWTQLAVLAPVLGVGLVLAVALVKPLNALLLGEAYAQTLGVRLRSIRLALIASTSLLAGGVTAFCGPVAFLGLATPHLARGLLGTADHRVLVPLTALLGAALALGCDLVARLPGSEHALPLNAVTSLIGAPVVIWIILRGRRLGGFF